MGRSPDCRAARSLTGTPPRSRTALNRPVADTRSDRGACLRLLASTLAFEDSSRLDAEGLVIRN